MIRLTVMYNLPDGITEEEFLEWRLGEHQENNASMPGVIRTDFARIYEGYPRDVAPKHDFMTIAEFPDKETFDKAFWGDGDMDGLEESLKRIKDYVFYITEILVETHNTDA
ncbi:MAG: hypothetical protein Q9P01_21450 [Anaerolineae bacterium]|nr:hypothetical protein [Anaerolineae bacterium]